MISRKKIIHILYFFRVDYSNYLWYRRSFDFRKWRCHHKIMAFGFRWYNSCTSTRQWNFLFNSFKIKRQRKWYFVIWRQRWKNELPWFPDFVGKELSKNVNKFCLLFSLGLNPNIMTFEQLRTCQFKHRTHLNPGSSTKPELQTLLNAP